jgi:hypothetical protein
MIRITITEGVGGAVIVDALVNVTERRVEMLQVETDCELSGVYIAEALVALELEIEMEARRVRKPEVKVILDTSKFNAALARYQEVSKTTVEQTVQEFARSRIVVFSNPDLGVPLEPMPFLHVVADADEVKRVSAERLTPALTNEYRARAMGLVAGFLVEDSFNITCEGCRESRADWCGTQGGIFVGYCNGCLPGAFENHMRDQADLDRLVGADPSEDLGTGRIGDLEKRPEPQTCEGGCE